MPVTEGMGPKWLEAGQVGVIFGAKRPPSAMPQKRELVESDSSEHSDTDAEHETKNERTNDNKPNPD